MIIPQARYFMNRLRGLLKGQPEVCPMIQLTASTTADLHLWLRFLTQAKEGISMKLMTVRRPSHMLFSDACPGGLGGYSVTTGLVW